MASPVAQPSTLPPPPPRPLRATVDELPAEGVVDEQRLDHFLDGLHDQGVLTLHDRVLPDSEDTIHHLLVVAGGVWVIEALPYTGRPRRNGEKLVVHGRDRTDLLTGLHRKLDHVCAALATAKVPEVPAHGALCFIDGERGRTHRHLIVQGIAVTRPKALRTLLLAPGELDDADRAALLRYLSRTFRPTW
jgi:hypothetical protein